MDPLGHRLAAVVHPYHLVAAHKADRVMVTRDIRLGLVITAIGRVFAGHLVPAFTDDLERSGDGNDQQQDDEDPRLVHAVLMCT